MFFIHILQLYSWNSDTSCGPLWHLANFFICFTIAVYCRRKVQWIFIREPCIAINFHKTVSHVEACAKKSDPAGSARSAPSVRPTFSAQTRNRNRIRVLLSVSRQFVNWQHWLAYAWFLWEPDDRSGQFRANSRRAVWQVKTKSVVDIGGTSVRMDSHEAGDLVEGGFEGGWEANDRPCRILSYGR